jgi:hypothetical protein
MRVFCSVGDLVPGGCGAGINCIGGVAGTCGNCQDASGNYLGCFQKRVTCNPAPLANGQFSAPWQGSLKHLSWVPSIATMVDYSLIAFALPRERPEAFGNGSFVLPIRTPSELLRCSAALYRPIATSVTATTSVATSLAPLANDGDTSTEWITTASAVGEWWVVLDLEEEKTVYSVGVAWGNAHPNSYAIEAGNDGTSWTSVHTETGGASYTAGQQPELTSFLSAPTAARWLRIRSTSTASVATTSNLVETGVATSGGFGGTCTCPDGQVY